MSEENLCFKFVTSVLYELGEMTSLNTYTGHATDKVIKIVFNCWLPGRPLYTAVRWKNQTDFEPQLRVFKDDQTNLNDTGMFQADFIDSKKTYEITKKIRDALLKTEIERLMYPLPEIKWI